MAPAATQSLLAGNGADVTCLRESREPITALNVATYVTPFMVRNFWLCATVVQRLYPKTKSCKTGKTVNVFFKVKYPYIISLKVPLNRSITLALVSPLLEW